jgi:hypothetical protein
MGRINIFDTQAATLSNNTPVNHQLIAGGDYTQPVRLFTAVGQPEWCAYEFIQIGGSGNMAIDWYQEIYGDRVHASGGGPPNAREGAGLTPVGWAREVTEDVGAAGAITHNTITRTITIPANGARWVPVLVSAPWVRLYVAVNAGTADGQYIIYAHVGGYAEEAYLEANERLPYSGTES